MEKIDMKKSCLNTVLAFACLFAATALPSWGQSGTRVDFTAPFPFTVGNVVLPAGAYNITTNSDGALVVNSSNNSKSAAVIAHPDYSNDFASTKSSVGFVRHGDQYALHKVGLSNGETFELADKK
jgi:hypothetical protein